MAKYTIYETLEYREWFETERLKSQRQIHGRVLNIELEGHFGHHKFLENNIWELKFNDGRRIYYAFVPESKIILLLGGNKNGQDKDIKKATKIFIKIKKIRSR
jgi:putative addiction module killer protein